MKFLQQYTDQFGTSLVLAIVAESFDGKTVELDAIVALHVDIRSADTSMLLSPASGSEVAMTTWLCNE